MPLFTHSLLLIRHRVLVEAVLDLIWNAYFSLSKYVTFRINLPIISSFFLLSCLIVSMSFHILSLRLFIIDAWAGRKYYFFCCKLYIWRWLSKAKIFLVSFLRKDYISFHSSAQRLPYKNNINKQIYHIESNFLIKMHI